MDKRKRLTKEQVKTIFNEVETESLEFRCRFGVPVPPVVTQLPLWNWWNKRLKPRQQLRKLGTYLTEKLNDPEGKI